MRRLLAAVCLAGLLAGCGGKGASFHNTDVTGADFGKDFVLTDHTGQTRSLADFRGQAVVVFFGFIHCADVCPATLSEIKFARQQLGDEAKRVQVLFITVDPERDDPALLSSYVTAFDPGFLGLYGDAAATAKVARDFKVFYQKVPGKTPGSYTVDHTAASFVFDPEGRLRLLVRHGKAEWLANDLRTLLRSSS
jgi:protein SCO1